MNALLRVPFSKSKLQYCIVKRFRAFGIMSLDYRNVRKLFKEFFLSPAILPLEDAEVGFAEFFEYQFRIQRRLRNSSKLT